MCSTGKTRYPDPLAAKRAQRLTRIINNCRTLRYKCPFCRGWHISSYSVLPRGERTWTRHRALARLARRWWGGHRTRRIA